MKNRQIIFSGFAILLAAFTLNCGSQAEPGAEIIRPVRFQAVTMSGGVHNRNFSGIARAGTEINLSFRIGGTLTQITVKDGQRVKKGALIATLDDADIKLQYDQTRAQEKNARIQMDTAKANLDRIRGLYENNNVPLSEYESAKNSFASAQSSYETAKKSTTLQRSQLNYGKLFAPMDGYIGSVQMEKNENVQAGAVVAVLNSRDDLEIAIGIPESMIAKLKVGDTAKVSVPALKNQTFDGVVAEVSYAIDPATYTYPVTVRLASPGTSLRPGMVAEVQLDVSLGNGPAQVLVPVSAVVEDQAGRHVFILEPAENDLATVRRQDVTLGDLTGEGFIVLAGLQEGQEIVTAGVNNIRDGLTVRRIER